MLSVNAIQSALAVSTNDTTTTPPLTPGYHIWHGSRYAVCPPGVPAPCANYLPNDFNRVSENLGRCTIHLRASNKMIRNTAIFLCLNKLEAKLIAKALKFTTSHAR
jgi:hypothetical protein